MQNDITSNINIRELRINKKDNEVIELKRKAKVSGRELANLLQISYNSFTQRVGGFCNWQPDERDKVIKYLENRVYNYESIMQQK